MASLSSGSTSFSLDVDDIIEEALRPIGGEHTTGIEASQIRRTLNLILIEMQNKEIPLAKLSYESLNLIEGQSTYTLDTKFIDVLELSLKKDGIEVPIERKGVKQYQEIPNKTLLNRPVMWTVERFKQGMTLIFWPIPNLGTYAATMLVNSKVEDINASYQKIDVSYRYYPLIVKWLSYELSLSRPTIPPDVRQELKQRLDEVMGDTFVEDRERTDLYVMPGGISGW